MSRIASSWGDVFARSISVATPASAFCPSCPCHREADETGRSTKDSEDCLSICRCPSRHTRATALGRERRVASCQRPLVIRSRIFDPQPSMMPSRTRLLPMAATAALSTGPSSDFRPKRMKGAVANWEEVAQHFIARLRTESTFVGGDPILDSAANQMVEQQQTRRPHGLVPEYQRARGPHAEQIRPVPG